MKLSQLSNQELNLKMQNLVKKEREVLSEIILHIQEVQRRKLFLQMGYSSLFSYLTDFLKYSAASAMRRIDAARLVKDIPESLQKMTEGSLNLSQVSVLQQSIRQVEKTSKKVSLEQKRDLVQEISGLSKQQAEVKIAQKLEIAPIKHSLVKAQADESVKIEMSFTKEEWEELELMRKLLSHAVQGELKDVMLYMARRVKVQKLGKPSDAKKDLAKDNQVDVENKKSKESSKNIKNKENAKNKENIEGTKNVGFIEDFESIEAKANTKTQGNREDTRNTRVKESTRNIGFIEGFESLGAKVNTEAQGNKEDTKNTSIKEDTRNMGPIEDSESIEVKANIEVHEDKENTKNTSIIGNTASNIRFKCKQRKALSTKIRKQVLNKYNCCQYIDKNSNRQCKSQWQLQIEHIQPVWAGGDNDVSNLSLLCGQHNRYQYSKQLGLR